jgi:hypothetical protein
MTVTTYLWPSRPLLVERSAHAWWLAAVCWFAGSTLGQLFGSPAALVLSYQGNQRLGEWALPGLLAVVLFGLLTVFWASLVLSMQDGARWARLTLTVLAVPGEGVVLWQVIRTLFAGPVTTGGVAQGALGVVALCAVPIAVGMMFRPSARSYFHPRPPSGRPAGTLDNLIQQL